MRRPGIVRPGRFPFDGGALLMPAVPHITLAERTTAEDKDRGLRSIVLEAEMKVGLLPAHRHTIAITIATVEDTSLDGEGVPFFQTLPGEIIRNDDLAQILVALTGHCLALSQLKTVGHAPAAAQ